MQVKEKIKEIRRGVNLSQDRFGIRLGISGQSVSAYETGRCVPTVKMLVKISREFNVSFAEISTDTRKCIDDKVKELEDCLVQLRGVLSRVLPL